MSDYLSISSPTYYYREHSSHKHKNNLFSVRLSKDEVHKINLRRRLQQLHRLFYGRYQSHTIPNDDSGLHDAYADTASQPIYRTLRKFLWLRYPCRYMVILP
jgi:hypothetical protein